MPEDGGCRRSFSHRLSSTARSSALSRDQPLAGALARCPIRRLEQPDFPMAHRRGGVRIAVDQAAPPCPPYPAHRCGGRRAHRLDWIRGAQAAVRPGAALLCLTRRYFSAARSYRARRIPAQPPCCQRLRLCICHLPRQAPLGTVPVLPGNSYCVEPSAPRRALAFGSDRRSHLGNSRRPAHAQVDSLRCSSASSGVNHALRASIVGVLKIRPVGLTLVPRLGGFSALPDLRPGDGTVPGGSARGGLLGGSSLIGFRSPPLPLPTRSGRGSRR